MGRRSGYDFPQGARRPGPPPAPPTTTSNAASTAAPARQGAQPSSITGRGSQTSAPGQSSGPPRQQAPPASSPAFALPEGFIPAHTPSERRAPQEYDSAREYAGVETGRLPQQPRVPPGRSWLAHEVRQLDDGPEYMPRVQPVPRAANFGGVGGSIGPSPPPQLQQQQAVLPAASSSVNPPPAAAAGQGSQLSYQQLRAWATSRYARANPGAPEPSEQQIAWMIRLSQGEPPTWDAGAN